MSLYEMPKKYAKRAAKHFNPANSITSGGSDANIAAAVPMITKEALKQPERFVKPVPQYYSESLGHVLHS
jgi:hypothetical protein